MGVAQPGRSRQMTGWLSLISTAASGADSPKHPHKTPAGGPGVPAWLSVVRLGVLLHPGLSGLTFWARPGPPGAGQPVKACAVPAANPTRHGEAKKVQTK
ncbi:hypothetical protein GQ53DRAFT_746807 [Thozetella sp. PMI_491]|nr:hypothetical protein GQ53DRAFT_746807 [Thozetella sp. PMI_491]